MNLFKHYGQVKFYDQTAKFINEYAISSDDLLFTSRRLYQSHLQMHQLDATYVFHDDYGKGEPSDHKIDQIIQGIEPLAFKRIIAIGGGTVLDIAKILALKPIKHSRQYFNKTITPIKKYPLIALPTTCGTGSEVTNLSICYIESKETKLGLGHNSLYPDQAVLIPELLNTLPFKIYMHSSIDALIHSIEAYLSPNANEYTDLFNLEAIRLILETYQSIPPKAPEIKNLKNVLMASNFAGIGFGNAGVGAIHALSYPLGGNYHVPHGESNYLFLTAVLKKYAELKPQGKIKTLNNTIQNLLNTTKDGFDALHELLTQLIELKPLKEYGMKVSEITSFSSLVIETQQRLLKNNYEVFTEETIKEIYATLY